MVANFKSMFERSNLAIQELESAQNLADTKESLQISVCDLYQQRILAENEAIVLLKKISNLTNTKELREFKEEYFLNSVFLANEENGMSSELMEIKNLREYIKKTSKDIDINNWTSKFLLLVEKIESVDVDSCYENLIRSWLADFLKGAYDRRCNCGKSSKFNNELRQTLSDVQSKFPDFLISSGENKFGKRNPGFIESAEATIERFCKLEQFKETIKEQVDGIIIGGSMDYGPFYNIRKSLDKTGSSDIDLMIILDKNKLDKKYWSDFKETELFSDKEKQEFLNRMEEFNKLQEKGKAEILSQKFHVEDTDFDLSAHFLTQEIFDEMIGEQLKEDLERGNDKISTIKDYRNRDFIKDVCCQRGFSGKQFEYNVPSQRKVNDGVIADLPNYIIENNQFYSGIYQNFMLFNHPAFYDGTGGGINKRISLFQEIMKEQLNREKKDGTANRKILNSHNRNEIFSPELSDKFY